MVPLKTLLRRIVQTDHMPRTHRDEILTSLRFWKQLTSLCLRTSGPVPTRGGETEDIVAIARNDVNGSRGLGCLLESGVDAQELAQADDVFVVVVHFEDTVVVGAGFAPEVSAAAGGGGGDEVAGGVGGEAGAVEGGGEGDGLGEVGGDGDDGDAVAGEDEGGYVGRVVRGLGVAEDGAI